MRRHPTLLAAAVLVALTAWLLAPALFSSKVLGAQGALLSQTPFVQSLGRHVPPTPQNTELFDSYFEQQPDALFARDALRDGHLPLWNPYIGAGEPLWASQQHAILFPINLLSVLGPFWPMLELTAALKLIAAGLGMFLFLRRLRLDTTPALLGAVSFAFSSYVVDWLEHSLTNSFVVVPWLMWATDRLAQTRALADVGVFALVGGSLLLSGHPETALVAALPVVPWFVLRHRDRHRDVGKGLLLLGAGGLLSFAIAAIVLVPFAELAGQASTIDRNGGPLPARLIAGFFLPDLWGRPDTGVIAGGFTFYVERSAYFGAVALVLAVAGLAGARRGGHLFCAIGALLVLAYVFGVPGYADVLSSVPLFGDANRWRMLVLVDFFGAALAAYGLQLLMSMTAGARRRAFVYTALGVAALPLVYAAARVTSNAGPSALRWLLFAGVAVGLIALAVQRPAWRAAIGVALVLLAAVDLVSYQRGFHPATARAVADPPKLSFAERLARLTTHARAASSDDMYPNLAARFGIRDPRAYAIPSLSRRNDAWTALGGTGTDFMLLPGGPSKAADVFGVRYRVSGGSDSVRVNRSALPRAYVAYGWRAAADERTALSALRSKPAAAAYSRPVIEDVPRDTARRPPRPSPARFIRDGDNRVTLSIEARRPGWLVLSDTWYPGWRAYLDGGAVPIKHANVAFRAVRVPAGRHLVAFEYKPVSARIGVALTLAGLLVTAGLLAAPALRRRPPRHYSAAGCAES